jgi:hypothetical protein
VGKGILAGLIGGAVPGLFFGILVAFIGGALGGMAGAGAGGEGGEAAGAAAGATIFFLMVFVPCVIAGAFVGLITGLSGSIDQPTAVGVGVVLLLVVNLGKNVILFGPAALLDVCTILTSITVGSMIGSLVALVYNTWFSGPG